jgi:hypothetical protein
VCPNIILAKRAIFYNFLPEGYFAKIKPAVQSRSSNDGCCRQVLQLRFKRVITILPDVVCSGGLSLARAGAKNIFGAGFKMSATPEHRTLQILDFRKTAPLSKTSSTLGDL